jgi:hypothetical protein
MSLNFILQSTQKICKLQVLPTEEVLEGDNAGIMLKNNTKFLLFFSKIMLKIRHA